MAYSYLHQYYDHFSISQYIYNHNINDMSNNITTVTNLFGITVRLIIIMGHNDTACRLIRNNNYCAGWLLLRKSCYSFCNNTTLLFMIWLLCTMTIICGWGQTSLSFTWGWLSSKIRLTVTRWMVIVPSQCWLWGCQCECCRYLSHHYWDGLKSCEFRYRWIFIISKFWTNNPRGDSSYNEDYSTQDTIALKQQLLLCHEIYCIIIASYYGWCALLNINLQLVEQQLHLELNLADHLETLRMNLQWQERRKWLL